MKLKTTLLSVSFAIAATLTSQAATIVWDGGAGAFGDANWTVDGTPSQNHTSFAGNTHTTTIGSGSVSGFQNSNIGTIDNDSITISGGAAVSGDFITFGSPANALTLASGTMTFSNSNSFRSTVAFAGFINFTGAAGSATIAQTDNSNDNASLAAKVGANSGTTSYFSIDGTMVSSGVTYNGSNLAAVNTGLAGNIIGGRYFEIVEAGNTQTLHLRVTPEPSSTALLGLGGLALILRRRK